MEHYSPEKLQYFILPSTTPPREHIELHNRVFDFWMQSVTEALAEVNFVDPRLHEEFVRQDAISAICYESEVIGVFLYSFFTIEAKASRTFRYMKENYPDLFFKILDQLGVHNVMATQYLIVHPDWRGQTAPPARIGLLLAGLSNRVRDEYGMDAGIGPTRKDRKVTDLFYAFGGDCIIADVENHKTPCDLVANIRGRTHAHPDATVRRLEESLWNRRIDLVGLKKSTKPPSVDKFEVA